MKRRQIYYRRKDKSIVMEGKTQDGKSILIWTLPNPEKLISILNQKASYFDEEKRAKILEKINLCAERPEIKTERAESEESKVRPVNIKRSLKDEEIKTLLAPGSEAVQESKREITEEERRVLADLI